MYYVLNLRKTHLIKGDELSTECGQLVGMLWRRSSGDESEAIKFRRPRWQMWSPRWEPSFKIHCCYHTNQNYVFEQNNVSAKFTYWEAKLSLHNTNKSGKYSFLLTIKIKYKNQSILRHRCLLWKSIDSHIIPEIRTFPSFTKLLLSPS